ncbi:MAG: helix-turn-helix domain-containing protein [Alphaproteobacteria bacterium]
MTVFAETLKTWRKTRRLSQLDLALEANVSARHISFLETGRARPSREMIVRLGEALHLPLAARNQMLAHGGFAARYSGRRWDAEDMAPIRMALAHMLDRHAPYPGFAVDRLWTIVRLNGPARALFGLLGIEDGASLLDLMRSDAMPAMIENWAQVARHAALRLRTESAAQGGIPALDQTADHLARVGGADEVPIGPVVPTVYRTGPLRLALFSTITQFGTPEDLALDDLRIELFFPADPETDAVLRSLEASGADPA